MLFLLLFAVYNCLTPRPPCLHLAVSCRRPAAPALVGLSSVPCTLCSEVIGIV